MQQKTIYEVALELARRVGWRNVTRPPLFAAAVEAGIVPEGQTEKNWGGNLRGGHGLSSIRSRLRLEPGITEGESAETTSNRSGSWREVNKQLILEAAYNLAAAEKRLVIPRARIAEAAGVSPATVSITWDGMVPLRLAVVDMAREAGNQQLVDQANAIGLTA